MKIKLKDKKHPITAMWCFRYSGYYPEIISKLNSGKVVEVEKIPKPALEFVNKVKIKGNK